MAADTFSSPPPPASTKTSLYEGSTQYRHWRFSPDQLARIRATLNAGAVTAIRDAFDADSPGSSAEVSFLDADEEHLLVKLYVAKIPQLCGHFRFPEEVEATAVTYLKRFYLKNTVMDWHPKNVMLTALFLATKTTNNAISLDAYTAHIPRTVPADVLDLEFLVAQSLAFDFAVWHAHRALWGLWLDIQTIPDAPLDRLRTVYDTALTHVRASRLTDAEFIYPPSQIALACLALADPEVAAAWAHAKLPPSDSPRTPVALSADALLEILEPLKTMITATGAPPDVEAVRTVDRRLKLCKNPEKVVGSAAYVRKRAAAEQAREEKRLRKAERVRLAMEGGDPFGSTLADDAEEEEEEEEEED